MQKYTQLLFLLFFFGCQQKEPSKLNPKQDSIKKYLALASNNTIDFDKRVEYNDLAYSLIDTTRNDSVTRNDLYKVCVNYFKDYEHSKIEIPAQILLNKSLKAKDSINIGRANLRLGSFYMMTSKNEKALEYFFVAKKNFKQQNSRENENKALLYIATLQSFANDFMGSLKTYFELLDNIKKYNLNLKKEFIYINIANIFTYLKQYVKAIEYYEKGYSDDKKESNFIINGYIAQAYLENNEIEKSKFYLDKNLNLISSAKLYDIKTFKNIQGLFFLKNNELKKAFLTLKEVEKELVYFKDLGGVNYNQIYLSQYYEKTKNIPLAIEYATKSVTTSKGYKNPNDILLSLNQLIKVDSQNASTHAQEYIRINDSLQIAERNFRDKYAHIAFETEEIKQQKEQAVQQKWKITFFSITTIVILTLLFIVFSLKTKQKELKLQQSQQQANEEIYQLMLSQKSMNETVKEEEKKRIAKELHDGVMNKLASARLNLSILNQERDAETIERCLVHISDIYSIEQEIRTIAHDLNTEVFDGENSFILLLKELIEKQNGNSIAQIYLELDESIDWNTITSEIKMHLFRIIQEAIQNSNKHSQADKISISFFLDDKNLCLSITDNGVGFDYMKKQNGMGLQNMKDRIKSLNGKISINSFLNQQTSINIAVPI